MNKLELELYREALEHHESRCDFCSFVTGTFCKVGRDLQQAYAMRAASLMAPIPTLLPRPKAQS